MNRLAALLALAPFTVAARADVVHDYDLKNVLWKLTVDFPHQAISGDVTNTLTLNEDTKIVELSCSELNVKTVTVNGAKVKFSTADDKLSVHLGTERKAGDTLTIRTVYSAHPTNGFYFVKAGRAFPAHTPMVYTQGEGEDNHYWVPTYDKPDDKATSESYITVPNDWTAVANGAFLGVKASGKTQHTFHWKMDHPHSTYLISLVAGPYEKGHQTWHKIPVDFYVPPGLMTEGKASFGATPKMIDLYSKLTGVDYPYAKFSQEAVGDFVVGGMENITAVTQTIRTLHNPSSEPVADSTYLVAHELAHQWFGDLVTCKTWEHVWLNEGFATTMPMFYDRQRLGQDAFDLERYKNFEGAIDTFGARNRKDMPNVVGDQPTVTMGSVYDGGCSRIMMLYHMMGEDTFWKAIHQYLTQYSFQNATTDDFFAVMHNVSSQDYGDFVKQWYHSVAPPSLTASIQHRDLVITQLAPYYTLDLPVWVWNGTDWDKKTIHVDGKESHLPLGDHSDKPLLVDPEVWTPMELHYDIPFAPADIATMYTHAPNAAQKARLINNGPFDTLPAAQRVALARDEKSPGVLQLIAAHIPQDAGNYLLEMTHNPDPRVVNAAVLAIGNLKFFSDFQARLEQIAANDPNELIREHATQVLLNWTDKKSYADEVMKKHAFDDGYKRMAFDWYAKHDPVDARDMLVAYLQNPQAEPTRVEAIKLLGQLKEAQGQDDVFTALVPIAQETSAVSRMAAINALAQLGNKKAIPILEPITKRAPGEIRQAAQNAIDQLNKSS